MQTMNKISLLFYTAVMLPVKLYRNAGIDTTQLALILRFKLIMDDRHPNTLQQTRGSAKKEGISHATLGTMLMALVMGVLNLISFAIGLDAITHMGFFFLAYLFMLASILISDFTSVLIDVRDNTILLPRPVNDRTLLLAKLLHIIVHMSRVTIPMCLPAFIFLFVRNGWQPAFSFLLLAMLGSIFTIFIINAVYLLVLKVTTPSRFKSFIAWFQVIFVIMLYGAYQLFPRVVEMENFQQFTITDYGYAKLFPPYWFAAAQVWLGGQIIDLGWAWFLLSLLACFGSTWLVVRYLAPSFNRKLSMISGSGGDGAAAAFKKGSAENRADGNSGSGKQKGLPGWLSGWLTTSIPERSAFLFSWRWTARNRGFRMRVYPTIGYIVVWVALTLYRYNDAAVGSGLSGSLSGLLGLIYISSFIIINAMQQVSSAEEFRASWIFYSTPVNQPGPIILGSFKAMLAKFFLPVSCLILVTGLIWKGPEALPNLVLGLSNQLGIACLILLINKKHLPASRPAVMDDRSGNFLKGILMLMVTGAVGFLHFLVHDFTAVVILLAILSMLACWLMLNRIGKIRWSETTTAI